MARVVRVVPDVSGLDKQFDYLVPEQFRDQVRVGTQVRVELSGRRVGGWVVAEVDAEVVAEAPAHRSPAEPARIDEVGSLTTRPPTGSSSEMRVSTGLSQMQPSRVAVDRLRPITKVSGWGPAEELVELAKWAAWRWCGPLRAVLRTCSPATQVRYLPAPRHGRSTVAVDEVVAAALRGATAAGEQDQWTPVVVRFPPCASRIPVIAAAAASGPTLVALPSVDTARIFGSRLRAHGLTVAVLPDEWAAAAGGVDVVIGARTAVWATVPTLSSIVVLDEHDESLQDERSPTWVARDVAVERARRLGIPCLLVSPSPSVAAIASSSRPPLTVSRVVEREGWPLVEVIDRSETEPWKTSLISSPLAQHLRSDRTVVCVINTVGRSKRLACRACRELTVCERCEATVHEPEPGLLVCGRCAAVRPRVCQACGGASLSNLRPGTARLREELESAAARPVVEVTASTGDEVVQGAGVYVGTEAVLHRVRSADVVAFLDLDAELLAPRYRAAEQAMALLIRGARLVGARAKGGRLLIHTRLADHPVIDAARHADPARLAEIDLDDRQTLGFPPFGALAQVSGTGAEEFVRSMPTHVLSAEIDDNRWLLKAPDHIALAHALARGQRAPGSRLRLEVDPARV